jgi:choice-of-anchor B domain-containing protein
MFILTASPVFAQNFNLQLRSSLEYPGQTLANICGYAQDGKEYALLGASKGMVIVDVTNPIAPVNIVQIPGPDNLWKEIKVYQHYAYITSEGGQGLQIVDLSKLPSPNLDYYYYTGDGTIADQLDRIHALHIDETKGFLYAHGGQLFSGGSKVFDLNADPYNPTYVGKFDALGYVHDGYADNDTLYACHINAGIMSIVDMSDKSNPKLLGTVETPGSFTHNSWLLDDRKTILTTDEDTPSFVTSYDISDPENIKELDRTSTNDGNNSIGHNTHVLGGWAVTSWYTDGVVISDVHRPDNMVITAVYDTWAGTGAGFDGCWGVYPYLPSGTVVVSNIPNTNGGTGKLFVFTPTYARACYLEGKILNGCDGQPLLGATIEVNSGNPWVNTVTKNDGTFKTGQAEEGSFKVTVSKPGYASQTLDVTLAAGQVTELNITLQVQNAVDVKGVVLTEGSSAPIANAAVTLTGPDGSYTLQTNANGQFELDCVPSGDYEVNAGKWGFIGDAVVIDEQTIGAGTSTTIYLEPGYYDDFGVNLGWTKQATASSGTWTLGEPVGTEYQNDYCNPEFDSDLDDNDDCYVTGNGGGQAGTDDVDNGSVTLSSPVMQLAAFDDAVLSFWYWFFNDGGSGQPNDKLEVRVTNGSQTVTVFTQNISASDWRSSGEIHLKNFITLNNNVRVQFIASDDDPGHVVEAGVDIFKVVPVTASSVSPDIDASAFLKASPNPSATSFLLNYDWPTAQNATLEVRNTLGQLMMTRELGANVGTVSIGETWPAGIYIAVLRSGEQQSAPIRLVKQ